MAKLEAGVGTGRKRREGLVLMATGVCFVALVGAGVSTYGDPELAGLAALARVSSEVASGVVAEWESLRRGPSLTEGESLTWASRPGRAPLPANELRPVDPNIVADALASESRRLEFEEGDSCAALEVTLSALGKQLGEARRAMNRLRAIQLAVRCGRLEVAAAQWELANVELNGLESLDGTSARLLCALAAAPALSIESRALARAELVDLWVSGELALPPVSFEGNPLREAYRRRLQAMLPESALDARLEQAVARERAWALAETIGQPLSAPADGGLAVLAMGERELIYRRRDARTVEGYLAGAGSTAAMIELAARRAELLPQGFTIDFEGRADSAGRVVRERTRLSHGPLAFVLRHSDPDSIISAVGERQALLRAAFFLLALGVAGAGLSVSRSLRRERLLAGLKSSFVANVSHELRTPISSILLMAENLERGRVQGAIDQQRYHHLIRREAGRLRRLVDDVLDFSRIERGRGVNLCMNAVDLAGFAQELEAEAGERVRDVGGTLRFAAHGLAQEISADQDALRRAILNLVDNALRHSGQVDVELELCSTEDSGLLVVVRDRGCGVPTASHEAIFAPFERLEQSSDPAGGAAGTGLGLAIVREIAEGHGGSVKALDSTGGGLTIELRIPGTNNEESV